MKQMSSAHSPTCGNSSLTSIPTCPYFLNVNGDRISAPVLRSVAMLPPGIGWPWYLSSIGFGSKLSTCERPPFMNRKMTCLALAAWCRPPDARVLGSWSPSVAAAASESPTRLANASMPKPLPMRHSASRRVTGCRALWLISRSVDEQELAGAEEHLEVAAERGDGEQLRRILLCRRRDDAAHHAVAGHRHRLVAASVVSLRLVFLRRLLRGVGLALFVGSHRLVGHVGQTGRELAV